MAQNNTHTSRSASSCDDGLSVSSFDLYRSL